MRACGVYVCVRMGVMHCKQLCLCVRACMRACGVYGYVRLGVMHCKQLCLYVCVRVCVHACVQGLCVRTHGRDA